MVDPPRTEGLWPRTRRDPWAAIGACATVGLVLVGILTVVVMNRSDGSTTTDTSNPTVPVSSEATGQTTPASTRAPLPAAPTGPRLGQEVMPLNEEPCRRPNSADGSAWQYGGLSMEGRAFEFGYWCNIFAGSVGSLEFVLEKGYGSLRMSIGFCDTSGATDHTVTFEVIADDKEHLIEPRTIAFGTVADLDIDVTGVTTLRLKISETHPARGTDTPSQPVFAAPTLTPA